MLVDLNNIVVQIQFSYHFIIKVQTSRFQQGLKTSQNTSYRENLRNKNYHKFRIAPNFEGSAIDIFPDSVNWLLRLIIISALCNESQ